MQELSFCLDLMLKAHSHALRLTCAGVADSCIATDIWIFLFFRNEPFFCNRTCQTHIVWMSFYLLIACSTCHVSVLFLFRFSSLLNRCQFNFLCVEFVSFWLFHYFLMPLLSCFLYLFLFNSLIIFLFAQTILSHSKIQFIHHFII